MTSKLRPEIKMILKVYTWVSHTVSRFFFLFVVLAILLYRAYRNAWPIGLNVLKIKVIIWKNDAAV